MVDLVIGLIILNVRLLVARVLNLGSELATILSQKMEEQIAQEKWQKRLNVSHDHVQVRSFPILSEAYLELNRRCTRDLF